jgi:hypothetical protein
MNPSSSSAQVAAHDAARGNAEMLGDLAQLGA